MRAIDREVVVTPRGKRFHRLPQSDTARAKDAACGGFVQANLYRIKQSEAVASGYSPCQTCDWVTVVAEGRDSR